MAIRTEEYLRSLIRELMNLPDETEWVEFKCNNKELQMIGEYISALSNSAALCSRPKGYMVWGIEDKTHRITCKRKSLSEKMMRGSGTSQIWELY